MSASNNLPRMNDNLSRSGRSGLVSRLGKVCTAGFVLLFVVCLGCLVFFAFLWGSDTNNAVWRRIVLAGWTTRSITITSLVLRWVTAAQAATCTSMLAAILLQRAAVPLPTAAAVSIMRFDNKGPWSLLGIIGAEWHRTSISVGLLAALLSVTTLSLQFTSTILLSQVGIASLPVTIPVPQTYYGVDPHGITFRSQLGSVPSFVDTTPGGYPAFAEWASNATSSDTTAQHGEFAPNNGPGIKDTGTVVRAFLPIKNSDERSRLVEYNGYGTAVDTRVVCMRPKLKDVVFTIESGFRLTGLAYNEQKPLGLLQQVDDQGSTNFSLSFDCGFAAATGQNYSEAYGWPVALCQTIYEHSKEGIYSVMEPKGKEELGNSYLLINATTSDSVKGLDGSDVWESITIQSEDSSLYDLSIQLTLCMTAFEAQELEINATRPIPIPPEPSLVWDTSTALYDTRAVLRQLGAGTSSISTIERGVFQLADRPWQRPVQLDLLLSGGTFSTTGALDAMGDRIYGGMMNEAQYSILSQMVTTTKNPALALQAFFTTLCAIAYYDTIAMFDTAAPSTQVSLVQVTRPLGRTTFAIVVSVAVLHLLLVLLVTLIFRRTANLSRIQNAWAAISQLFGPTTDNWIRDVDNVDDKTVRSWLKTHGVHRTLVKVGYFESRVQLVEKDTVL